MGPLISSCGGLQHINGLQTVGTILTCTRRYGPLREPISSAGGGLWHLAKAFFGPFCHMSELADLVLLDELNHGVDLPGVHVAQGDEAALPALAGQAPHVLQRLLPAARPGLAFSLQPGADAAAAPLLLLLLQLRYLLPPAPGGPPGEGGGEGAPA